MSATGSTRSSWSDIAIGIVGAITLLGIGGHFIYTRFIDHQVTTAYFARQLNATLPRTEDGVTTDRAYESPKDTLVVEETLLMWTAVKGDSDPAAVQKIQEAVQADAKHIACTDINTKFKLRPSAKVQVVVFNVPHDDSVSATFARSDCR